MTAIEKLAQGDASTWAILLAHLEPAIEGALRQLQGDQETKALAHTELLLGVVSAFNRTIRGEEQAAQDYNNPTIKAI